MLSCQLSLYCSRGHLTLDIKDSGPGLESLSPHLQVYIKDFRVFQGNSLDTKKMKQVDRVH